MDYNKESINTYLKKLGKIPLLTKDEEIEIGKKLEKNDILIIKKCIKSKIFLKNMLNIRNSLSIDSNVVRLTKKLILDSCSADVETYRKIMCNLLDIIELYLSEPTTELVTFLYDNFIKFSITNTGLKNLIKPLKEIHKILINLSDTVNDKAKFKKLCKEYQLDNSDLNDIEKLLDDIDAINKSVEHHRNKLINSNRLLVVSRVRYFLNKGLDFSDLIQEGNIGLIKSVDKFEYQRGCRFSTYAVRWVDQAIRRAISNKSHVIRIPIHVQDAMSKVEKAVSNLKKSNSDEPTIEEICKESTLTRAQVETVFAVVPPPISMETELTKDLQLKDLLQSKDTNLDPYVHTQRVMFKKLMHQIISLLSPRSQMIIRLRFGIGESKEYTLEEIGSECGDITKERVRQIIAADLKKLKKYCVDVKEEL